MSGVFLQGVRMPLNILAPEDIAKGETNCWVFNVFISGALACLPTNVIIVYSEIRIKFCSMRNLTNLGLWNVDAIET